MSDTWGEPAALPDEPLPLAGNPTVDWITEATRGDLTVAAAIPPGYTAYAIVMIEQTDEGKRQQDAALVDVLRQHSNEQSWWLGYLDTGVADVIDPAAPRVGVYGMQWPYVLRQGRSRDALEARTNDAGTPWHSALPELIFPQDRSWLVSTMWDDDWRCVGGPEALMKDLLQHLGASARAVGLDEDRQPAEPKPTADR